MESIVLSLKKRHRYGLVALLAAWVGLALFARFYPLSPSTWIPHDLRKAVIVMLYCYKMAELTLFCYLLIQRPLRLWKQNVIPHDVLRKRLKTFYFLTPQGSIVFALIAYKVSGNLIMGWGLLLIGTVALWQCRPTTLADS